MRMEISDCNIISFFPFSENQKPDEMEIIPPKTKIANPKSSEAKQINIVVEVKKTLELEYQTSDAMDSEIIDTLKGSDDSKDQTKETNNVESNKTEAFLQTSSPDEDETC